MIRVCVLPFQTHTLGLTANYDDDLTKFAVWSKRGSGTSEIFLMTARSPVVKKAWVDSIKKITEDQYFKARGMLSNIFDVPYRTKIPPNFEQKVRS